MSDTPDMDREIHVAVNAISVCLVIVARTEVIPDNLDSEHLRGHLAEVGGSETIRTREDI
jgi:hypothetical protein